MRRTVVGVVMLGVLVVGCSQTETSTPATATSTPGTASTSTPSTSTPSTSRPATTVASTVAPVTSVPTTSAVPTTAPPITAPPTTMPSPTDAVTHVYAGVQSAAVPWQRMGVWDGTAWVDLDDDASFPDPVAPEVGVTSVDFPAVYEGAYTLEPWGCIDDDLHAGIVPAMALPALPEDQGGVFGRRVIGVTATWPLQPRPVTAAGLDADIYQSIGEALLADTGVDPSVGDVTQVVRVDLDGNGTEEVLVTFERVTPPFGDEGDLSLVYVRSVVGNDVDDIVLAEYVVEPFGPDGPPFPPIGGFRIAAIADLNGDARMEIVLGETAWEYGGTTVWEFDGTAFTRVLTAGCGV